MLLSNRKKVLPALCTIASIIQVYNILYETFNPYITTSYETEEHLTSIPVIFKLCPKPAFNLTALIEFGYGSDGVWSYTIGRSKFNRSIYGWAGHTKDGSYISNTEDTYTKVALFPNPEDIVKE